MKIHIVQHDILTLRPEDNLAWIESVLDSQASRDALLTVFPSCTVCGAPLFAAAGQLDVQKQAQDVLQRLVERSEHRAFIVGLPLTVQDKGLCNALVFVQNGAIRAVVTKKYLGVDEQRHFVRGEGVQVVDFHDERLAIGFYEDMKELVKGHVDRPDTVVCCGSQVFDYRKPYRIRYRMIKTVEALGASVVYVNRTGCEGPFLHAGGSMAMNAAGGLLAQLPYFEEASVTIDTQLIDTVEDTRPEAVELVYKGLVCGLRDYFRKNGLWQPGLSDSPRAVLGLSGGIDSALVATLAVDALGPQCVHGLLMPSQYSTDHSVADAVALAQNLGMSYDIVPIKPMFDQFRSALEPVFAGRPEDVTEENLQARIRGTLVMSYANKFGALALNTTNRSEAAMGYGTLYGVVNKRYKPASALSKAMGGVTESIGGAVDGLRQNVKKIGIGIGAIAVIAVALWLFNSIGGKSPSTDSAVTVVDTTSQLSDTEELGGTVEKKQFSNAVLGDYLYTGPVNKAGNPDGKGEAVFLNKSGKPEARTYKGDFVDGVFESDYAEYVFYGDTYSGSFKSNYYEKGTLRLADSGEYFEGYFSKGQPHTGTWYNKQGKVLEKIGQ